MYPTKKNNEQVKYNQLSNKLKEELRIDKPLDLRETVVFKILASSEISQNGMKNISYPKSFWVPPIDRIYDPYWDKEGNETNEPNVGKYVVIAISHDNMNVDDSISPEFRGENKGAITITGRDLNKMHLLYYLRACNFNKTNPRAIRVGSSGYMFLELQPAKSAKDKIKLKEERHRVEQVILNRKESELVSDLKALGLAVLPTFEENKSFLLDWIQDDNNRKKWETKSADIRKVYAETIELSKERKYIFFDTTQQVWKYKDTQAQIGLIVPTNETPEEYLLGYFHNDVNGKAVHSLLEARIQKESSDKLLNQTVNHSKVKEFLAQ